MKRLFAVLLILIMALGGCSSNKNEKTALVETDKNPKHGGTVKMACVPVDTLNPLITSHASVSDFLSLVYDGLFSANEDLTARGVLASDYVASEHNTIYTIKLKKNVRFHNGKLFDAEDVVATLGYITMYGGKYSTVAQSIILYQATDKYTVTLTLKEPISDFVNNLDFPILPAGLNGDAFAQTNSGFVPCGTGMYKYDGTTAYKNIHLSVNESWHGEGGRANIDSIDVEILSDEDTIISAFDAGAIDTLSTSWKLRTEMEMTSSLYNTFEYDRNRLTFVGINTASAAFDTVDERRILSESVNKEKLAEDIMLGDSVVANSPLRENVYFNKANEWGRDDEDNSRTPQQMSVESGSTEIFLLYNSDSKTKERLALALKHQLSTGGYSVVLDGQPFVTYLERVLNCHYDIYIGEVSIDNSSNLGFMFGEQRNGQNVCCFADPELMVLVSNVNRMSGSENKSVAWENFEKYYNDKVFQLPLYFTKGHTFVNKRIKGELTPDLSSPYNGFENLYVDVNGE